MQNKKYAAILSAALAAFFYSFNMPFSKLLLQYVAPAFLAAFLYLGAGIGVGVLSLFNRRARESSNSLTRGDLPFVGAMILLDIAAPVLLMFGLTTASSANASLLNNFEIVATSLFALLFFREHISARLWFAIGLITFASALLSYSGTDALRFTRGSLLVIGATICWGLENNCTRRISARNTFQIVFLKGIFSGIGSFIVALVYGEAFPPLLPILLVLLLGFVAYGLSIFLYVRAQKELGAAKTSAYYAIAPFLGALLSFSILREHVSALYFLSLAVMLAGSALVVTDTLLYRHSHLHTHTVTQTPGTVTQSREYSHSHEHAHLSSSGKHTHRHPLSGSDPIQK